MVENEIGLYMPIVRYKRQLEHKLVIQIITSEARITSGLLPSNI